jgi:hypothetical protein
VDVEKFDEVGGGGTNENIGNERPSPTGFQIYYNAIPPILSVATYKKRGAKIQLIHVRGVVDVLERFGATHVMNVWRKGVIYLGFASHVAGRCALAAVQDEWTDKYKDRGFHFEEVENLGYLVRGRMVAMMREVGVE